MYVYFYLMFIHWTYNILETNGHYDSFSKLQFTVTTIEKLKYTHSKSQKQRKYNAIIP